MKIYNSVTIDMKTLKVIEEDSFEYSGPIDECKGGGNAGTVGFAPYIEDFHEDMVGTWDVNDDDLGMIIGDAQTSPYDSAESYNPDNLIALATERIDYLDVLVKDINEQTDWETIKDAVKIKVDSVIDDSYIDGLVDEYTEKVSMDYAQSHNNFSGGMAEINAINSSAYILGMSNIERQKRKDISTFRQNLIYDFEKVKHQLYETGLTQVLSLYQLKLQMNSTVATMLTDTNRLAAILKKEQYAKDLEIDRMDIMWKLEVMKQAGSVLAAPGGGTYLPEKPSDIASAASGALSGAATGAAIGSVVPGVGTAIGAGVGALVGAFSG